MLVSICRRSGLVASKQAVRTLSVWSTVPAGPPDPILGTYVSSEGNGPVPLCFLPYFKPLF